MEKDDEAFGEGNSYTTEFRQYDPRLGRWKSLDPLMTMFPWMSPYVAFDNNPIYYTDPYGLASGTGDEETFGDGGSDGGPGGDGEESGRDIQNENEDGLSNNDSDSNWGWGKNGPIEELPNIAKGDHSPNTGRDMKTGTLSGGEIKKDLGFSNAILNSRIKASNEQLFKDLRGLGYDFATGDQQEKMVQDIITHFEKNTGTDYSSWDLTNAANNHPSTIRFKADIGKAFQKAVTSGLNYLDDPGFSIQEFLKGNPRFNEVLDNFNGLRISVNDVWTYSVKVVTYQEIGGEYIAQIQLTLFDHFGLDKADIVNNSYATIYPAFYSWYILQHSRGFKPFVTVMNIPIFTISGKLNQ